MSKSKGKTTYWATRIVGCKEVTPFSLSAHNCEELRRLGQSVEIANEVGRGKSKSRGKIELVRVEVTPV